ncbi:MAG: type II toxin-antitoxin system HicB family antitoxin [Chloroflexi bacterium]|nr:type II toxin-antitoxin system HicB family antitoxin [Chloroflexota bacterium]
MEYKGYLAEVEYDDSVQRLHGQVINTGAYPIATFETADPERLREEFHRSIDEYLASCVEDGVEPIPPFSAKLQLRLGSDLHRRVTVAAAESGQSIDGWITQVLDERVRSAAGDAP